jgi:thiosulfate dehydrogenase [quinone] large subunit
MRSLDLKSQGYFSTGQMVIFTLLRVAIGWHFLYEGLVKVFTPGWSSAEFLQMSNWIFSPVFHSIAENASALQAVDSLNIWGPSMC